jgi:DNA-binding LacI/PurR family transcriptional regulator
MSTKAGALATQLKELALRQGPSTKLPGVRELIDVYGTNSVTLTAALNELERRQIIYRKNRSGVFVSPYVGRIQIAVLLDHSFFCMPATSPFWSQLWGHLAREAQTRARDRMQDTTFHLVIPDAGDPAALPVALVHAFDAERVDAIIGVGMSKELGQRIEEYNVPFAALAGPAPLIVNSTWDVSYGEGLSELIRLGCGNVGFLSPCDAFRIPNYDETGTTWFKENLKRHGLDSDPDFIIEYGRLQEQDPTTIVRCPTIQDQGYEAGIRLFGPGAAKRPDALIINNDLMTSGLVNALNDLGVKLWDDVKILTNINLGSPVLFHVEKRMIGAVVDTAEIAHALYGLIDNALGRGVLTDEVLVKARLVVPQSNG